MIGNKFSDVWKYYCGHYDYNHGGSSQSFLVADQWTSLLNDGTGGQTSSEQKPTGDCERWNTTTGQFDFTGLHIGDRVELQFEARYTTGSPNTSIDAQMLMSIGGFNYVKPIRGTETYKNAGEQTLLKSGIEITMDNQETIDYPAEVQVKVDNATSSIVVTGWKIFIIKRGL